MTEKSDSRSSSEDLIKEARDGFGTIPVADDDAAVNEQADTPASDDDGPLLVREPLPPEPVEPEGAADPFADNPVPPSAMPQHTEYAPYTPSREQQGAGKVLKRFRGLILAGVIVLGGALWNVLDSSKSVEDLAVGDCLAEPSDELITKVETINCDEAHDYEVYAVVQLLDPETAPYPGQDETYFTSIESCFPRFETYIGMAYADSLYDINTIYPTEESWDEDEDREVICLVAEPSFTGDIVPVTGSLRNIRQ